MRFVILLPNGAISRVTYKKLNKLHALVLEISQLIHNTLFSL